MKQFFKSLNPMWYALAGAGGAVAYFFQDSGTALRLWVCVYYGLAFLLMLDTIKYQYDINTFGIKTLIDKIQEIRLGSHSIHPRGELVWFVITCVIALSPIGKFIVLAPISVACLILGVDPKDFAGFTK